METSIFLLPQPSGEISRQLLNQFVSEWNRGHIHTFTEQEGIFQTLRFPDSFHPECQELLSTLQGRQANFQVHISRQRVYDAADYSTADFIEIYGAGLDDTPDAPVVVNASQVLTPAPCPACGYGDAFDQAQTGPLVINETRFDQATMDGVTPPGGWDFIDVDAGLKIVSSRFAEVLAEHQVRGYMLEPVLTGVGGPVSKRFWQLRARQAIVCPCSEHTPATDGYFCPTCGAAHCSVEAEDHVRDNLLGDDEIFARHRNRGTMLYVSGRVYQLLLANNVQQVRPNRIFRKCHHRW